MRLRATQMRPGGGLKPLAAIIRDLFASGEQGVWYDPSDLTTLFQDAAGTIPVTAVEQPVGLMLDKSKGLVLGAELVTNGDFSNGLTGWSVGSNITASVQNGEAQIGFNGPITSTVNNWFSLTGLGGSKVGQRYRIEFDATFVSGGDLQVGTGYTVGRVITGASNNGVKTRYSVEVTSTIDASVQHARATFGSTAAAVWKLDNISVRELLGNHASQTTATSRPVLSARVNLLTKTEDFAAPVWTASKTAGASVVSNTSIAPNGTFTADTVTFVSASDYIYQPILSYSVKTGDAVVLTYHAKTTLRLIGFGGASPAGADVHTVTPLSDGWYLHKTVRTFTTTTTGTLQIIPGGAFGAGAGSYIIWGADLRPANTGTSLPDYQRVNTATDYDTAGFPYFLRMDGVDDFLVTPSIDFTSTDKMMVCAGVRRLADTASQMIVELGVNGESVAGSWFLAAQYSASYNLFANSLGVPANGRAIAWLIGAAPTHDVVSFLSDLAGSAASDRLKFRRNGGVFAGGAAPGVAGTGGNYGNYPLYIGRRAGTSLSFNGHLYSLIIRGAAASDSQIKSAEKYINGKTRAF